MIFSYLQYVKPIWYFNLKPKVDYGYFLSVDQLKKLGITMEIDQRFESIHAQERDLAFRAFQSGIINTEFDEGLEIWEPVNIPIKDEYLFLRKNFHWAWVFYVLIVRILSLNNPWKEVSAFVKTRSIKKFSYANDVTLLQDYTDFKSELIASQPRISVIIPTLNRYDYLKDVLKDLEKQSYKNFEVIVVDQTENYKAEFYQGWDLDLKYWYQEEKALWRARNEAIESAQGAYILLYDDDSLIEENWIVEHLKCLDYFKADISSGVSISKVGDKVPFYYSYFRWSDQIDTGNVLIKKEVFETIGYFDRKFEKQRMGDGEYGLRAYLAGMKNISNPYAKRIHLKVAEGGLREMGSWDGWRPKKLFGPRPVPSVLYLSRKYFGNTVTRYYILKSILPSLVPYEFKGNRYLKLLSFILIPFLLPLICFQVWKSWSLSNSMLK